jgi:hypothetical protein
MNKQAVIQFIKRHSVFMVLCLAFWIGAYLIIFRWYNHQLNPDATSYFTIAQKYAHFDFRHAVNGYWGPLLSWMLVPAVWLHLSLILAAKCLIALMAIAVMTIVYWFLLSRKADKTLAILGSVLIGINLLGSIAWPISPDLLLAMFITIFAVLMITFVGRPHARLAGVIGAVGALMYFSKGFGFYLFLAIAGGFALWQYRVEKKFRPVVVRYLPMAVVFMVLVVPYIAVISAKYGHLTISTVGSFDRNMFGPVAKGVDYPMQSQGPLAPPNDTAISVWEDPTLLTPLVPGSGWSPLKNRKNFNYMTNSIIGHNLDTTYKAILDFGPVAALGALLLVLYVFRKKFPYKAEYVVLTAISVTMVLGYSLILVESRYLLAVLFFSVIAAALWITLLRNKKILSYAQILAAGLIVCGLSLLMSLQNVAKYKDINDFEYAAATVLQSNLPKGANIISDTFNSYYTCYQLELRCYSILNPPADKMPEYDALLKKLGVQYYVDYGWNDSKVRNKFVSQYFVKLSQHTLQATAFTIYKLR